MQVLMLDSTLTWISTPQSSMQGNKKFGTLFLSSWAISFFMIKEDCLAALRHIPNEVFQITLDQCSIFWEIQLWAATMFQYRFSKKKILTNCYSHKKGECSEGAPYCTPLLYRRLLDNTFRKGAMILIPSTQLETLFPQLKYLLSECSKYHPTVEVVSF